MLGLWLLVMKEVSAVPLDVLGQDDEVVVVLNHETLREVVVGKGVEVVGQVTTVEALESGQAREWEEYSIGKKRVGLLHNEVLERGVRGDRGSTVEM
jgi:hypothetical protein